MELIRRYYWIVFMLLGVAMFLKFWEPSCARKDETCLEKLHSFYRNGSYHSAIEKPNRVYPEECRHLH